MPAVGAIGAIASGVSTVGGAVAGALGDNTSQSFGPGTALEGQAAGVTGQQLTFLSGQGIKNLDTRQSELDALLAQLRESGGLPSGTDIRQARAASENLFQGQRNALQDQFRQQSVEARQRGAQLGRSSADPVFTASLAESQGQQLGQLEANRGSLEQQLALQLPQQRLAFEQQRFGLAEQAFKNRSALAQLGNQISVGQQNLRTQNRHSGGGLGGAISGAIGGLGAGRKLIQGFNSLGGGQSTESNQISFSDASQGNFGLGNTIFR